MKTTTHGTGIEWTHVPGYTGETWNPVRGCTKVSPGCKHCYAETFAERWRGVADHPYEQGFDLRLVPDKLGEPLRAKRPRAYFVNSMSDLHQEGVSEFYIRQTYAVMQAAKHHLFMVLTKRAERMRDAAIMLSMMRQASTVSVGGVDLPRAHGVPSNVWLGVSVEDRKYGLPRVDILRTIPAAVRFLSIEPLLEDLGPLDLTGIHWVIVGGESGPGARPFDIDWAETIVQQCVEQGTPVFLKQLGAVPVRSFGDMPIKILLKSKKGSDEAEWPAHLRGLKQFPKIVRAA